jgi:hypothetical protein
VLGAQINMFTDRPVPLPGPCSTSSYRCCARSRSRKVHWLRLFIAYNHGQLQANEVLLDSEQWPGGEAVVADSQAPVSEERVAVRIFGLLVPDNDVAFQ